MEGERCDSTFTFPRLVMDAPSHVIAGPGDQRSLCGVKDPSPRVVAEFVERHQEGWGMVVCADCASVSSSGGGDN